MTPPTTARAHAVPRSDNAGPFQLGWSRPPLALRPGCVMSTPLTDDSPDLGPYRSSRSRALASSDGPLPVTLYVGPPAPFAGTFGLTSLAAGCGLMWWGELVVPARDWPQRLRPVWQSVGILALVTTGLACAGCALLTICFASCTVEFSRRHLRHELRLGWLCLHRTLPLAGSSRSSSGSSATGGARRSGARSTVSLPIPASSGR